MSESNSENPANMVPYFKQKKNFTKYWKTVKNTGKVREICKFEKVGTMHFTDIHVQQNMYGILVRVNWFKEEKNLTLSIQLGTVRSLH